jgi:adenylosuccinate lyase
MREGLDVIERDLAAIAATLEDLTEQHADTPTMGRTHSVHALPMTFGLRTATWLDEIDRQRERVAEIRDRVEVLEFFGAVGTLASLGDDGLAVQEALSEELDLAVPDVAWFTTRDRVAEVVTTLAMVSATLARISDQILLQNREEFDELAEPFEADEVGSSTMPHKRNPVRTEETVMLNRLTRAHAGTALELMVGYDERDFATALAEFAVVPETFLYTSRALQYTHQVLEGLVVDETAMAENLDHHGDLVAGEAVMMALAEELGRQTAHDMTHEAAMAALDSEQSYAEALLSDDHVSSVFSAAELEDLLDPESYTGLSAELAKRALDASRARD